MKTKEQLTDDFLKENVYYEYNNNRKVLDLIHSSIISEGGDGDAIWLSKHTPLNEMVKLIDEYNTNNNIGWEIQEKDNHLLWGKDQEWAIITCDEEFFDLQPSYIVLRINY